MHKRIFNEVGSRSGRFGPCVSHESVDVRRSLVLLFDTVKTWSFRLELVEGACWLANPMKNAKANIKSYQACAKLLHIAVVIHYIIPSNSAKSAACAITPEILLSVACLELSRWAIPCRVPLPAYFQSTEFLRYTKHHNLGLYEGTPSFSTCCQGFYPVGGF